MKYIKIRLDFKYAERGRFYRTILVREDATLDSLGELFVDILGGTHEHMFMFTSKNISYVHPSWVEDSFFPEKTKSYDGISFKELGNSFLFTYDTGDGYDFNCKVYKYSKDIPFEDEEEVCFGFVLDGKGMGIWEDNIHSLIAYLSGEIPAEQDKDDEEKGYYKPWNFDIERFGEFDNPIDIEELNEIANGFIPVLKLMQEDEYCG
jgi:hypothetical protein